MEAFTQVSQYRKIRPFENKELESMWMETVVACINLLFDTGSEKNQKTLR
jgi:hypothetical protein